MEKGIKITLTILFFFCLVNMPYGYFQLVRFMALIGFSILAYQSTKKENKAELVTYVSLAVLFQPIFKIALGRQLWNIVDVIVGIGLIASLFIKKNEPIK